MSRDCIYLLDWVERNLNELVVKLRKLIVEIESVMAEINVRKKLMALEAD